MQAMNAAQSLSLPRWKRVASKGWLFLALAGTFFFSTLASQSAGLPVVITQPAFSISVLYAQGLATINPNGADTSAYFEYWDAVLLTVNRTAIRPLAVGTNDILLEEQFGPPALNTNALYYFRAVASNQFGVVYGAARTFRTGTYPVLATSSAQEVTPNSATLTGTINPIYPEARVYFYWGAGSVFENRTPDQYVLGSGSVQAFVSGLLPDSLYHFRLVMSNVCCVPQIGGDTVFTTTTAPPGFPAATTLNASNVTVTSATLNGRVNANGFPTSFYFEWGPTTGYGNSTATQTVGSATTPVAVQQQITGLSRGSTYHFRAVAVNANGVSVGGDSTLTTPSAPETITLPASAVTTVAATLNAAVTPNGGTTAVHFEWGTTTNYGNTTGPLSLNADSLKSLVEQSISGLTPFTTYHYRVVASNPVGFTVGADESFVTAPPPTIVTLDASDVRITTATLNASVLGNGFATSFYFQWGGTTNYGNSTALQSVGNTTNATMVQQVISGLSPLTTYHFRVVAISQNGISTGVDKEFATGTLPEVFTTQVSDTSPTTASLKGFVNPKGTPTSLYFEWGTTASYGNTTAAQSLSATNGFLSVQQWITGLTPLTRYHYRPVATNLNGVSFGVDSSFLTPAIPVATTPVATTLSAANIQPTTATLNGSVKPNAGGTVAYFVWGETANYENKTSDRTLIDTTNSVPLQQLIGGLRPGATYHFRIVANNPFGISLGDDAQFSVVLPPVVTTAPASNAVNTTVTLNGTVNSRGFDTTFAFEWGATTNYGNTTPPASISAGTNTVGVQAGLSISSLVPSNTYHFRVVASNVFGVTFGQDVAFTNRFPPAAITLAASNVENTTANLNATVNSHGLATTWLFRWGLTTAYENSTPILSLPAGSNSVNVQVNLSNLTAGVTYHYRIVATNGAGPSTGGDQTFIIPCRPGDGTAIVANCTEADFLGALACGRKINFQCDGTIRLTQPVAITSDRILDASGHNVVISGGNSVRIFDVQPGASLSLVHVTVANGRTSGKSVFGYNGEAVFGGALNIASASLAAMDCVFESNAAFGASGGGVNSVNPYQGMHGGNASGGAIFATDSSLTLSNCVFRDNQCRGGFGAPVNDPVIAFLTGLSGSARGGAVFVVGGDTLFMSCVFANNRANGRGGGGALWSESWNLTLTNCQFVDNSAEAGGAISDQSDDSRILHSSFRANFAVGTPGVRFYAPEALPAYGGAYDHRAGIAAMVACAFTSNIATGAYPSAYRDSPGCCQQSSSSGGGGALAHRGGYLSVSGSLLSSNIAQGGLNGHILPADIGLGLGGGILSSAPCAVTNSTFVFNRALPGARSSFTNFTAASYGGAIAASNTTVSLYSCTIAQNSASSGTNQRASGGGLYGSGGNFEIANCILSQNQTNGVTRNLDGLVTDLGHNISSDGSDAWTSGTSSGFLDPLLLPLANNGGPTLTMALRAGSPALNAADPATSPATDQRGYPRPSGSGPDIGAYEGLTAPVLQIFRESSVTNMIRWFAEPARVYQVEQTSNLKDWTPVATNTVGADGISELPGLRNPSPRFFRVVAQ
jgi:hypothetical protein